MIASWPALVLLVLAQPGGELPERLPVPPEHSAAQPSFAPAHEPAYVPTLPPATQDPRSWAAPQISPLSLPPPPVSGVAPVTFAPLYELPPQVLEPTWDEPPLPGTRLSFATLGAGTGFSTTTFDINHTWLFGYGEGPPLNVTPGWGIHFWGDGVGLGLPARVYDLYVDLSWTPWTGEHWSVSVGLTPGLYSDFAHVSGDMFQLTGWIIGTRPLGPEWQLVLGAAYIRQLQTTLVPVGGVIWTPSDDIRLELIFPKPKYAVRYRETEQGSLWWFVAGQLGGGAWAVADDPNDALVAYSDWRLVVGVESFRMDGREWTIELGYAFDRQVSIDNHTVAFPGSTFSLSGSLAF
jgi:hypothetical protein